MAVDNKKERIRILVLFAVYLICLFYFLFFSEAMGRTDAARQYRYNLTLFREIKRFYMYRRIVGYRALFLNVIGNIAAFMPFGYFVPKLFFRGKNPFVTVLLSFELSLLAELLQLIFRLGCFDVDDLLLNTLGGFLGYLVCLLFGGRKRGKTAKRKK